MRLNNDQGRAGHDDQSEGTVKVAPPGVTRAELAVTRSVAQGFENTDQAARSCPLVQGPGEKPYAANY